MNVLLICVMFITFTQLEVNLLGLIPSTKTTAAVTTTKPHKSTCTAK